jgi:hypothetical protein
MIQVAWDWLQAHRTLTNRHLIATDGLNVKRSAEVWVTYGLRGRAFGAARLAAVACAWLLGAIDQTAAGVVAGVLPPGERERSRQDHQPRVLRSSETAEKVRVPIQRAVSARQICLDRHSEALRTTALTSPFGVYRIASGEIDFFSGLVDTRHFAGGAPSLPASR